MPGGFSRRRADDAIRDAMMAIFGIGHTFDTRVGDEFVRGVSGGERKRVSICEAALGSAKLQCWDNSTRGLDSGNAVAFCENLRLQADVVGVAAAVAIYQAPQKAYDVSYLFPDVLSVEKKHLLTAFMLAIRPGYGSLRGAPDLLWQDL